MNCDEKCIRGIFGTERYTLNAVDCSEILHFTHHLNNQKCMIHSWKTNSSSMLILTSVCSFRLTNIRCKFIGYNSIWPAVWCYRSNGHASLKTSQTLMVFIIWKEGWSSRLASLDFPKYHPDNNDLYRTTKYLVRSAIYWLLTLNFRIIIGYL